jgi:hypothetical protein
MKILRVFLVFCSAVLFSGCAYIQAHHDYDPDVDFAGIKTYDWLPIPEEMQKYELTIKHIKRAVNQQLSAKGLTVTSENPDILIAVHGGTEKKINVEEWGYRYSHFRHYRKVHGFGGYHEYGRSGIDVYEYLEGTLTLDFVDAKTKELIWRGMAVGETSPSPTQEEIDNFVTKILEKFPPAD